MSLVSIIINCHNGEKFLFECLQSVYNQTYENFEVIFYDNSSSDASKEIFEKFMRKNDKYFFSNKFLSLGEARFNATNMANGKYISFIDVDDVWKEDKLKKQIKIMKKEKSFISFSNVYLKNENLNTIKKSKINSKINLYDLITNYQIYMPTVVLKKTSLNFDKNLHFCPDFLLFMNYILNYKFTFINEYLATYRFHENSFSNSTFIKKKQFYEEIITLGKIKRLYKKKFFIDNKCFKIRLSEIMLNRASYYFFIKKYQSSKILKKKLLLFSNFLKFILIYLLRKNFIPFKAKIKLFL